MSKTVLLLGDVNDQGIPQSAIAHFGKEAYDHYMVGAYIKELLTVRNDPSYVCWSPDFARQYAAMLALSPRAAFRSAPSVSFEELGSTLFSTIDKFDKLAQANPDFPKLSIDYVGIEISDFLADTARTLHMSHSLSHFKKWQEIKTTAPIVSRSYQSTSYAFQNSRELFDWICRSKYGIHGVWWSVNGSDNEVVMGGNRLTHFNPDSFKRYCDEIGAKVSVIKSETSDYRDTMFSASWIVFDRMSDAERAGQNAFEQKLGIPPLKTVCGLNSSELTRQPSSGSHAGFIPIQSAGPFNFMSPEMAEKFAATLT